MDRTPLEKPLPAAVGQSQHQWSLKDESPAKICSQSETCFLEIEILSVHQEEQHRTLIVPVPEQIPAVMEQLQTFGRKRPSTSLPLSLV